MALKTYTVVVVCDNCQQQNSVEVPKGTTKIDAIETAKLICDNCGCVIYKGV